MPVIFYTLIALRNTFVLQVFSTARKPTIRRIRRFDRKNATPNPTQNAELGPSLSDDSELNGE